jgi:hypothetical protein
MSKKELLDRQAEIRDAMNDEWLTIDEWGALYKEYAELEGELAKCDDDEIDDIYELRLRQAAAIPF